MAMVAFVFLFYAVCLILAFYAVAFFGHYSEWKAHVRYSALDPTPHGEATFDEFLYLFTNHQWDRVSFYNGCCFAHMHDLEQYELYRIDNTWKFTTNRIYYPVRILLGGNLLVLRTFRDYLRYVRYCTKMKRLELATDYFSLPPKERGKVKDAQVDWSRAIKTRQEMK